MDTIIVILISLCILWLIPRYIYLELLAKGFKEFISYKDSIIAMKDKVYMYEKEKWLSLIDKMKLTWRKKRTKW